MLNIQPQYLSLSNLFEKRLFRIPEYQRAYSWTRHQRADLFQDLLKTQLAGKDEVHFMAAVVCLRRERQELGTDDFQALEIVDGQQRITTLIVLLKSICLALDPKVRSEAKLQGELQELLVKPEADELLLLQTNHDSSHYFARYLREGEAPASIVAKTTADREILEAIEDCKEFVTMWSKSSGSDLLSLAALLKNRVYFLLHEIDQEKTVYTVFEVLNSRGLTVSWLDRLKSILMGMAFDLSKVNNPRLIKDLHITWRDIYTVIGLRQGLSTEALRFAATLRAKAALSRPLSEEDAVEALRNDASGGATSVRKVAAWLLEVTQACDTIVFNTRLNAVTRISQARLLAVAIVLRSDLKPREKSALLAQWEKVTFRIYGMLRADARRRVGQYVRLAWQVTNGKLPAAKIRAGLIEIGQEFPIDNAVKALRGADCYDGWEIELRYLMFRYEEYLSKSRGMRFKNEQWEKIWLVSPSESIEHILPQSKAAAKHKHRLGNLVLLPPRLNSQLQDKPPKDKVGAYRDTGLLIAGEVAEWIEKNGWDRKTIDAREQKLLDWIENEWAD